MTDRTCQKWSAMFRAGDVSLDDALWSGSPAEADRDQTKTLTKNNPHYTTWEIADMLEISKSIVIDDNEKCVFYFSKRKVNRLFGQPNTNLYPC